MTEARLIDGKALAAALRTRVAAAAADLRQHRGITPGLAAILVGNDPASEVYIRYRIDGKALAAALRTRVAAAAADLRQHRGITPGLAAILVGNDPASEVYI